MLSESKKSEEKEQNVANGISEILRKPSGQKGNGIKVDNNSYSDVAIHMNGSNDDTYVEVKLDSNAALGKYICQFSAEQGIKFDFSRLKKDEVEQNLFDVTKKVITERVEYIINQDIKQKIIKNLNTIKDQINILLKDKLASKTGSMFTKNKHIRKGFVFDVNKLVIKDISFPLFFNKLNDFYEALNKEDQEKYISLRNEIRKYVRKDYVKEFDEIILKNLNDNSINQIERSLDFIEGKRNDIFSEISTVEELLLLIKDIYIKYHDMLSELDIDNDSSKTINQLEPIEKTCYTYKYFIEATKKDDIRLEYIRDNDIKIKSFIIQSESFGNHTNNFNSLIDSIIDYYRNFDKVSYIQIGDVVMNLEDRKIDPKFDPLHISNVIGNFRDFYHSIRFNLHVISERKNKQNMQMRLYINGFNHNESDFKYSLDCSDKNFTKDIMEIALEKSREDKIEQDELEERINKICNENLTIPQNVEDKTETELYKKLEKNYDHADRIIRWYRNAKKSGVKDDELKKTFIDNLDNIKDLFKTYEEYLGSLKRMKLLNKKVKVKANNKDFQFDPVEDVDKIRRLEGFQLFVKAIGDTIYSDTAIDTSEEKYAITDIDRKNIRLLGFSEHVMCWCTEGYETTNKFVFQLWQNSETIGRGDVYGDPSKQTPYCTHSKEHWDNYSKDFLQYQQFWYLKKLEDDSNNGIKLTYEYGDLTNKNVVRLFNLLKGKGSTNLIAMNDSGNDFLDNNDADIKDFKQLDYGNEVEKLNTELFELFDLQEFEIGGQHISSSNLVEPLIPKVDIERFHNDTSRCYGDLYLDGLLSQNDQLTSLTGCPQTVQGKLTIGSQYNLHDLQGAPQNVKKGVYISSNPALVSLKGCPKQIGGSFTVSYNLVLQALDDFPQTIKGRRIDIHENPKLSELREFPQTFTGAIQLENNNLLNLKHLPQKLERLRIKEEKTLETLEGGPSEVNDFLIRECPELKSLDYAPIHVEFCTFVFVGISKDQEKEYKFFIKIPKLLKVIDERFKKDDYTKKLIQGVQLYYNDHLTDDKKHYKESGISLRTAFNNCGLDKNEANAFFTLISSQNFQMELNEKTENSINESSINEFKVSETPSNKYEVEIKNRIEDFLKTQTNEKYRNLSVEHYEGSDSKFHSDIFITNPLNNKQIWIEVKKNKYSCLGGMSFKYDQGNWTCNTVGDDNPLKQFYLSTLNNHSEKFIEFCKDYLHKDDIKLPTDMTDELLDAWKKSGNITDTENETQFITNKIPLEDFGSLIARFYKTAKKEPVYYIQVGDDLYIVDEMHNPLNIYTKTGNRLKTISEAYRIGRIQFRVKAMNKNGERYFAFLVDTKILSDKENVDNDYSCSFDTPEKWPIIKNDTNIQKLINEEEDKLLTHVSSDVIENTIDNTHVENKRFDRSQFTKYFGIDEINWCVLADRENNLAIAAMNENQPFDGYHYLAEIQTLKKGCGKKLIEELVEKYKKVWLMANTVAGNTLIDYYRKLNLKEIVIPDSVYGCPAYFFCSNDCDYDKLESYCIAFYANDSEDINEADEDIGGEVYNKANELYGLKIWIDDKRESPDGFIRFKKVNDFIQWCYERQDLTDIALIDTDHDAGDYQEFGGDYINVFNYLDFCGVKNILIHIHSSNPIGASNIRKIISKNKDNGWKEVRNS